MSGPARFGCGLCKFATFPKSKGFGDTPALGECRRNAPRVDSYGNAQWPVVQHLDWCGDGRPRDGEGGA